MKLQHVTWQLRSCRLRSLINLRFEWQQGLRTGRGGSGSAPPPPMPLSCPLLPCSLPCCPPSPCFLPCCPPSLCSLLCCPHPPIPSLSAPYPPFPFLAFSSGNKYNNSEVLQIDLYFMHISLLPVGESCSKEMLTQISFSTICNIVTQDYAFNN